MTLSETPRLPGRPPFVTRLIGALALATCASAQVSYEISGPCRYIGQSHALNFTPGAPAENFIVTASDPDTRRFIVYVPSTYTPNDRYPVVFMLHGTGQLASSSYNNLTWDEAAEALGFIAVFPEALEYLLLDGTRKTKWATEAVKNQVVDPSELPLADDALFIREVYNTLGANLSIDCKRVYATGFSNGGAFVKTSVHVELSDVFAATASAGGAGVMVTAPGEFFPQGGFLFRPHLELLGTKDANRKTRCVTDGDINPGDDLPLAAADIIATPCLWDTLTTYANELGMDPAFYSSNESTYTTEILWQTPNVVGRFPREYRFRMLLNLDHAYPSGNNWGIDYVPIIYDWMMRFQR